MFTVRFKPKQLGLWTKREKTRINSKSKKTKSKSIFKKLFFRTLKLQENRINEIREIKVNPSRQKTIMEQIGEIHLHQTPNDF